MSRRLRLSKPRKQSVLFVFCQNIKLEGGQRLIFFHENIADPCKSVRITGRNENPAGFVDFTAVKKLVTFTVQCNFLLRTQSLQGRISDFYKAVRNSVRFDCREK